MLVTEGRMIISVNSSQKLKTPFKIEVTVEGIVISLNDLHL